MPSAAPTPIKTPREIEASGFVVLRTPLLPFDDFLALSRGVGFYQAVLQGRDLDAALQSDRELIRARLLQFLLRPEVQEALWLAAPEFLDSLELWKEQPDSPKAQKMERALYRYAARITSRPTPFGLFAGCSLGTVSTETRLEIGPRNQYTRRSRLDMEYLCNLAEKISADPAYQRKLCFRSNTSLYLAAGRYHHAQSYSSNQVRCYRLVATEATSYLTATLQRAAEGASPADLALALVENDPSIAMDEAETYIRKLIDSQVLVSDLIPPITGPEPVDDLLVQLENLGETSIASTLQSASGHLRALDDRGVGNGLTAYRQVVDAIRELAVEFKPDHLIQVDLLKKAVHLSVDPPLLHDILRGVELLRSLGISSSHSPFQDFKADFRERYQEQEIPLVLALDEEVGIGFERKVSPDTAAESLIENIDFSGAPEDLAFQVRHPEILLLRRVEELAAARNPRLELDAKLLEALRSKNPLPLPAAFAAMVQIIEPAGESQKRSLYLQGVTGPSGALLLGRFCPADEQLARLVREHLRREEENRSDGGAVHAEIIHLPEGRVGNVICRPVLRQYEIPYLAHSRVPSSYQIPITDLMLSLKNDRIVLRSQRLGREVIPRLTSAHSYMHGRNLKLYKFLCLLQAQGVAGSLSWDWGFLEEAAFLPRVTMGNLIFAPARWRIAQETIEQLADDSGSRRLLKIDAWRNSKAIPRFVLLAEGDNQLLIDFENVLSVETFIEYSRSRPSVRLMELLAGPDSLCASGPEGNFTHELIVPFVRTPSSVAAPAQSKAEPNPSSLSMASSQRMFLPGSEWLFVKIYASPSQIDRLLVEQVKPLVEKLTASGEIDRWFFIRYGDPHWHLRLRFQGNAQQMSAGVLPGLYTWMAPQLHQGKLSRMQLDTYDRELERYGGVEGMRISERLFQHDSELVLELLAVLCNQADTKMRWRMAFVVIDELLNGLGLDLDAKRKVVNNMRSSQESSFGVAQAYRKQVSEKFRAERATLDGLLTGAAAQLDFPESARVAIMRFAGQVKGIRNELHGAQRAGQLSIPPQGLAASYVHMHLNRIFRSAANAQEMVLYDFLVRAYESRLAKEKRDTHRSGT